jgi:hypothetical protein
LSVVHEQARETTVSAESQARAQQWGKTAVGFILSATATAVFMLVSYVLWPINHVPAVPCIALAVFFALIFAYNAFSIVRWWIVLAKRNDAAKS